MARYLNHLDSLKEKYITTQNSVDSANYPFTQFHYYQNIEYIVDKTISFSQTLRAVKLVNTAILLIDPETQTKVYFILLKEFSNAIKNAYYNANGIMPKSVRIYIDRQPDYNFTDVLNFMIYFWHACNIMTIKCSEGDSIAVSFSKNTSVLWDTYSELVKQVSFSEWGE